MKNLKLLSLLMALVLMISVFAACTENAVTTDTEQTEASTEKTTENSTEPGKVLDGKHINDIAIDEYTIVYSAEDHDYSQRAAAYIQEQIKTYTGAELEVSLDTAGTFDHEIVVGETSREISETLNADTEGVEFAIYANDSHIAMEGDYFVIAAAAYFFVETYVATETFDTQIPKEVSIHQPIVKEAKNFILLIGDGMGFNQTLLFNKYDAATTGDKAYSDGEDFFYGYMLPYQGKSNTTSLTGVTDSAAGGTALSTGYKTYNYYVGRDKNKNDIQSLTELAGSRGMATAVLSTDYTNGATPAAFSAHANDRNDSDDIAASQSVLKSQYGTIIKCGNNVDYTKSGVASLEKKITDTLGTLSENEKGFFLMYEEAQIDKHCHKSNMDDTFNAVVRFNQAIAIFMEYAFYNPDTLVIITADHETGGLTISNSGEFSYTSVKNSSGDRNHTGANVPVFAYGMGAEMFSGKTVENVQIPKQIAKLMGVDEFGGPIYAYEYF